MPSAHGRQIDFGTRRHKGAGDTDSAMREAQNHCEQQRRETDRHGALEMVPKTWFWRALHRTDEPSQNVFVESLIGSLQEELLTETLFATLTEAGAHITAWKEN